MIEKKGFTLIEVMVGVAMLGGLVYLLMNADRYLLKASSHIEQDIETEEFIQSIYNNVKSNINLYQVDETITNSSDFDPDKLDLPMGWGTLGIGANKSGGNSNDVVPKSKCGNSCPPGSYGVFIHKDATYSGIYIIHIVYENSLIFQGRRHMTFFTRGD